MCAAYVFAYAYVIRSTRDAYCDSQTCPNCPTLKQNIVELQEKIIILKRKLKETKKQLQDKESGVYLQVNFVKIMPNCSVM